MQLSASRHMRVRASPGVSCSSRRPAALALAPRRAAAAAARAAAVAAAGAQPLADVALGGGRLANKLVESITNPKEDKGLAKQRQKWREQQEADKARQQRDEESDAEHQQQLQAAGAATAAHQQDADAQQQQQQLVDPLGLPLPEGEQHAAAAGEAVAAAVSAQQAAAAVQQGQHSIVSEYTEELVEVEPKTAQQRLVEARQWLGSTAAGKGVLAAGGLFLAGTLAVAVARTWQKYSSPRAQRIRTIDKNKLLVEELAKFLPGRRGELSPAVVKKLRGATGFSAVEVFRKYLWFLLRERSFDDAALADMVALKAAAGLSDDEVAEALRERAQRIYDKYGTMMLNTEGMTAEGVERKATCRALFGKLLYLTEHEALVAAGSEAFKVADLRTIFGATDEDVDKMRIVSLHPMDVDRLESLMAGPDAAAAAGGGPDSSSSSTPQPDSK